MAYEHFNPTVAVRIYDHFDPNLAAGLYGHFDTTVAARIDDHFVYSVAAMLDYIDTLIPQYSILTFQCFLKLLLAYMV